MDNIIGKRLRSLRLEHQYSQAYVAERIGVRRNTYLQYESGYSRPTRKLNELSNLFNVSVDYILGRTDTKNSLIPINDNSPFSQAYRQYESEQEKRDATARELLRLLCKDNPQALAIIDSISVSANADISLPDADKVDEAVLKTLFANFISALQNAKSTGNGIMVAEMKIPKTE